MNQAQVKEAIATVKKGANVWVVWERPAYLKKGSLTMPLTKRTKMLCRIGVSYDNIQVVKEGRENGDLPAENAGLRGREWVEFPTLIRFIKSQLLGLRLEKATFDAKTEKQYFLAGVPVDIEDYKQFCLKKEYAKRDDDFHTFDVKIRDLISIHNYSIETEPIEAEENEIHHNFD